MDIDLQHSGLLYCRAEEGEERGLNRALGAVGASRAIGMKWINDSAAPASGLDEINI